MQAATARRMKQAIDPVHVLIYFVPEAQEEYAALGLEGPAEGYFPARAAPLGRVPWQVVQATFFGFSPLAVQFGMARAWEVTTPEAVTAARLRGAVRALTRLAPDLVADGGRVTEALELCRAASAGCPVEGRPLCAAQQALPEPDEPLAALWHQIAVLREYRGDGHLAALLAAGLDAPQALVLNAAGEGGRMREFLQRTRAWDDAAWAAAAADLAGRGWVDADEAITPDGRAAREQIEEQTDRLALSPWRGLGADGCARLAELVGPISAAVVAGGGVPGLAPPR